MRSLHERSWWVRAVDEFLGVLQSSPLVTRAKKVLSWQVQESTVPAPSKSLIDQGPYVNVVEDGMVAAAGTVAINDVVEDAPNESVAQLNKDHDDVSLETENDDKVAGKTLHENNLISQSQQNADADDLIVPMRRHIDQLSRHSRISIWLLVLLAVSTTWPLVGSTLTFFLKRRFKRFMPTASLKR
ncbi:hypothetical protein Patl1_36698 [Pistacia atlantica]|nr:hypothetical protein Patl1_36698 [Pistacia atlantica]